MFSAENIALSQFGQSLTYCNAIYCYYCSCPAEQLNKLLATDFKQSEGSTRDMWHSLIAATNDYA